MFETHDITMALVNSAFGKLKIQGNKETPKVHNLDMQKYQLWAERDRDYTKDGKGLGIYQCYCENHFTTWDFITGKIPRDHLCHIYADGKFNLRIFTEAISISVVVVNLMLRTVSSYLIEAIGLNLNDEAVMNIMTMIFVGQYINTGILLVVASANFEHTPLEFIGIRNQFTDYNMKWYLTVADQLENTMFIQAFMPYVNFLILYSLKFLGRFADSKFTQCRKFPKTKKKTKEAFAATYAGPDVSIHFRYASILNDVWVTFTYGIALPTLFPICLLGLFNMYVAEKLMFAYFYKQPPMYDNKLNRRTI